MVIGTDRLEFYEYIAKHREARSGFSRQSLRIALGITALHFVIVKIPQYFSIYFGDEVSPLQKKLGSKDESDLGLRLNLMKQRKEL